MHFSIALLSVFVANAVARRPLHDSHDHLHSHAHLHNERQHVKKQANVFVTGAAGLGDGQIHSRLEISELQKRTDQWALYIQALANWQNTTSTSDATSYYQIAGIHGVPKVDFDEVGQCSDCGSAWGYCTHYSVLFPAWHRTYVALWEQQLIQVATDIASQYPAGTRDAMMAAASTLRQPYWDWAAKPASGSNVFPDSFTSPQITVEGPDGQIALDNPLYKYEIPDVSAMYFSPYVEWDQTLRYPTTNEASASSQESQAVAAFNNIQSGLQQQVYGLLTNCPDYLYMSNQASGASQGSTCSNNLEGIHDTVHITTGGPTTQNGVSGGHMSSLPVASFDAIFMLHHANVDRLFALWQTANPDSYGASQVAVDTTWTIATGSTQDENSDLTPFRKDADSFWTTNGVRDFENTFKYTYPEYVLSNGSQSTINKYVGMIYGVSPSLSASSLSSRVELPDNQNTTKAKTVSSTAASSSVNVTSSVLATPTSTPGPSLGSGGRGSGLGLTSAVGAGLGGLAGAISSLTGEGSDIASAVASDVEGVATALPSTITGIAGDVGSEVGGLASDTLSGLGDLTGVLFNVTESLLPSFLAPNGSIYQYGCHFANDVSNINGSYFIYVFDGQPTPATNSSDDYLFASNLIGIMAAPATGMFMNGRIQTGSVPLTSWLHQQVRQSLLPSMAEEHILPYLGQNLVWKLVVEGNEVALHNNTKFQAAVYSSTSTSGNGTTQWSEPIPQVQVTKGKPGGAVFAPQGAQVLPLNLSSSTCSGGNLTVAPVSSATLSEESTWRAASTSIPSSVVNAVTNYSPGYPSPVASSNSPGPGAPQSTNVVSASRVAPANNGTARTTGWRPSNTATGTAWNYPTSSFTAYQGAANKATFSLTGAVALVAVAAGL